jgi:hypothetical protein
MNKQRRTKIITVFLNLFRIVAVIFIVMVALLQGYVIFNRKEVDAPLPLLFGNFPVNRAILENQDAKDEFAFAIVGDTRRNIGTFERISEELRGMPLDFAVLLGDCTTNATELEHQYFRVECADEYAMPFPVFYVVGNHDVSPEGFPLSRFEKDYGPSIFSFVYQRCLFVMLGIFGDSSSTDDSIAFLKRLGESSAGKYRHVFVFMHYPPQISPDFRGRDFPQSQEIISLFDKFGVDYVFAGDFHGYAKVKRNNTTYIVTGGGGAPLIKHYGKQFHHAVVMSVGKDFVVEKIVPVPESKDIEDLFERFVFREAMPWMKQNMTLVFVLDGGLLFLVFMLFLPAILKKKKHI